jgi:hypothetical protein
VLSFIPTSFATRSQPFFALFSQEIFLHCRKHSSLTSNCGPWILLDLHLLTISDDLPGSAVISDGHLEHVTGCAIHPAVNHNVQAPAHLL